MKKKIFKVALAVVIMGAGFFVWQSQHSEPMSELVLANIEALASGESEVVKIPCRAATGKCEVPTEDADGNTMTTTYHNYVHI